MADTLGVDPAGEEFQSLAYHGGNLDAARRAFPQAPQPWVDLSTGINPSAYPVNATSAAAWERLPSAAAIASLEIAAAESYGTDARRVVATPGSQAIIQLLPHLFAARRVAILGPTYAEHALCWRAAGAAVTIVDRLEDLHGFDAAVVVNPNNPDGRLVAAADLAELSRRGTILVIDEAFMDVMRPSASLVPNLPAAGTIVLRSFGKTYGLAGLRLGFAIASDDLAPRLRGAFGPWAVSGPAIEIGRRALGDSAWLARAIDRLERDCARLDFLLNEAGLRVIGGTPLFRLVENVQAGGWFVQLARKGILARPFVAQKSWLRFGLPAEDAWPRIGQALREGLS